MIPADRCECCGKYKAYRNGMCWGCLNEYKRHEAEFLRLKIDELMVQLASDSGKADE